jgi:opacity protein-like surface antigen
MREEMMMTCRLPVRWCVELRALYLAVAGVVLSVAGGGAAQAQALPTATSPGAYLTIGGTYSEFKAKYPNTTLSGYGGYVDINFRRQLGLEFEGHYLKQGEVSGSYQTTYLVGPRLEFHRGRLAPYAKGLVGNGHLIFPYGYGYGNYLVLAPGGGLDVQVTERIKLRLVDFEYQVWPQFSLGEISPYGVSAGVSYEIFNPSGWRRHRYR